MPEDTREQQDHPYLPHYEWSSVEGDDERFDITPERAAENARHAADKDAVEGGRTLRLVLAAPVVIWSFIGIPALALLALVILLDAVGLITVDYGEMDAATASFFGLLVLVEITSIWEGLLLMRDRLDVGWWRAVTILSVVVALAVSSSLALSSPDAWEWLIVVAMVWYCVALALWQWRRSVRLASAVERLEDYSP
jgi:hypothetical protein